MVSSQSILKIAPALLAAQKEMGNAVKDSINPYFKSKFADLNSVREAVTPALHANGISILQLNVSSDVGRSFVRTTLLHESGEFICSDTEILCSKANDAQAQGSAISYARRYGLSSMLSIGADDNDGETTMVRSTSSKTSTSKAQQVVSTTTATDNVSSTNGTTTNGGGFGSFRKNASTNG